MTATTTIAPTNSNTVSIRGSGSNARRLTACVACAQDGTKLPIFLVFKAKPGGLIERRLPRELPSGVYGCCQENGWMVSKIPFQALSASNVYVAFDIG